LWGGSFFSTQRILVSLSLPLTSLNSLKSDCEVALRVASDLSSIKLAIGVFQVERIQNFDHRVALKIGVIAAPQLRRVGERLCH
jgi:hypothetical protein